MVPVDGGLGQRAGMLLARSGHADAIDATVVCLAADDILTSDPGEPRALAEAAGSTSTSSPSEPPPASPVSARSPAEQLFESRRWDRYRKAWVAGSSNISGANELWKPSGEPAWSDTRQHQATCSHGSRR
jgi:hypothetical protein